MQTTEFSHRFYVLNVVIDKFMKRLQIRCRPILFLFFLKHTSSFFLVSFGTLNLTQRTCNIISAKVRIGTLKNKLKCSGFITIDLAHSVLYSQTLPEDVCWIISGTSQLFENERTSVSSGFLLVQLENSDCSLDLMAHKGLPISAIIPRVFEAASITLILGFGRRAFI